MNLQEQLQNLLASLARLGWRRLAALGLVGATVFLIVGVAGYYLSRPSQEVLYAGLDRQDVSGIGAALTEAGIAFDVSSDGTTILVRYAQTAQARMLLAEKGLPHSTNSGYELYDKLGSLGLTSFMQDVTRVRALEGELARTIQTMNGVRAARRALVGQHDVHARRAHAGHRRDGAGQLALARAAARDVRSPCSTPTARCCRPAAISTMPPPARC